MNKKVFYTPNGIKIIIDSSSDPRNVSMFDLAIKQNTYQVVEKK